MANPRSTYLFNVVLDSGANPVQNALVSVALVPITLGITYNFADSFLGDTVTPSVLKVKTADAAPALAPTVGHVAGATAVGAGTYQYQIAFLKADGTGIPYESAASVATATVTALAGDTINLTAIPVGPPGTTARAIYRTSNAGTVEAYLATILDNTTTVYADTLADAARVVNRVPLSLGGWHMSVLALGDLLPATGLTYVVTENGVVNSIAAFAYSATSLQASSLYATSVATPTPTAALTGYVLDPGGNPRSGVGVTAKLSMDGVSTVTGNTVSSNTPITATTDGNGLYALNLVPTDRMTPAGLYYTVLEGPNAVAKTISASHLGGTVNGSLTTPVAQATSTILRGTHVGGTPATLAGATTANAGTGASATTGLIRTDVEGQLGWTSGTAAWATGSQFALTFALPYNAVPQVILVPANAAAWTAFLANKVTWAVTPTAIAMALSVADAAATTYLWGYICSGY